MKCLSIKFVFSIIIFFSLSFECPAVFSADHSAKKTEQEPTLLNRIDFGNSYIMGQSIKSGAVYLMQRKKSEIKSMLNYREDYRDEILEGFEIKELKENTGEKQTKP
jgi:hypothetical protein